MKFGYEDLEVWNRAVDFAVRVIDTVENISTDRKHYRLLEQIESSSTSVPMNIAEGKGRQYKKEFIQFLYIAEGSLFEVLTLTEIFGRRQLFKKEDTLEINNRAKVIDRKLHGLINSLRRRS